MTRKHDNLTINYKFNQAELDARILYAELQYENATENTRRFDYELGKEVLVTDAAKVRVVEDSVAQGLQVFSDKMAEGYTLINTAKDYPTAIVGGGVQPTIVMSLRKPQHVIELRRAEIKKEVEAAYRVELEAKHAEFIEALAEREVAREEQKEIDRLAAIEADKAALRGQRIQALKKELTVEFPA